MPEECFQIPVSNKKYNNCTHVVVVVAVIVVVVIKS
jgi:hypothetical protein